MSQSTLDEMMAAALMTRATAISNNLGGDKPWEIQFATALAAHMNDEACRWLASKGCYKILPDGMLCPGVLGDLDACDRCTAQRQINLTDAKAAVNSAMSATYDQTEIA